MPKFCMLKDATLVTMTRVSLKRHWQLSIRQISLSCSLDSINLLKVKAQIGFSDYQRISDLQICHRSSWSSTRFSSTSCRDRKACSSCLDQWRLGEFSDVVSEIILGQVAIEWIKENVPTIVEAFYPGEQICFLYIPFIM